MAKQPAKPNRTLGMEPRVTHLEELFLRIQRDLARFSQQTAQSTTTRAMTEAADGGSSSGSGSASTGDGDTDANSIQGELVSETSPVDGDLLHYQGADSEWQPSQVLDGSYSIGTGAAATARLHLPAGTAAANTAPLKFTAGTDLTSPEAGAVEFDGLRLEFTPTSVRKFAGLTSAHITSTTTVANTVTPTTLYTGSIPANSLAVGQTYVARVLGRYSTANAVDTVALAIKVASVTVFTVTTTAASVTNAPVMLEFAFTVRSTGAGGTGWGFVEAETNAVNKTQAGTATFALDTTAAADVTVVATWSAADPGNSISIDQAVLFQLG